MIRLYHQNPYGVWEYMSYEFQIFRNTAFPNKEELITAFQSKYSNEINGSDEVIVPAADWHNWIPNRIDRNDSPIVDANLGVAIGERRTIPIRRKFRYQRPSARSNFIYTIRITGPFPASADRRNVFERVINNDPEFDKEVHDFPKYAQWGYDSLADFIQGYDWLFRRKRDKKTGKRSLVCIGQRHTYTLMIPITDADSGNLIFNFYPNSGSPHPAIMDGLVVTDEAFFERV